MVSRCLVIVLAIAVSQIYAASFSDLTKTQRCNTFEDCEANQCCVVVRTNGILGKRQLNVQALESTNVTDGLTSVTGRPVNGSSDAQVLELLRQLAALKAAAEQTNKPNPELGKLLAKLGQDNGIQSFLNSYPGRGKNMSSLKRGVCKKLSEEGEQCVNYLNGPHCPCGDNLDCRVNEDHKFNGFGAISGVHDLHCVPI